MQIIQNNDFWSRPVEIMPYVQAFPSVDEYQQFDEKRVIVSENHDILFGIHSSKSFLIKHMDALETLDLAVKELFDEEAKIEVTSVKQGAFMKASLKLDSLPSIDLGGGDVTDTQLMLTNNYARAGDFKLLLSINRRVCQNGAVVGHAVSGFNARQLIDEGFNATSLQSKVARMVDEAKALYGLWSGWRDIKLGYEEAYAMFSKHFSENKLGEILSPGAFPCDMWECYNSFTAHATHASKTASGQMAMDTLISKLFYNPSSPLRTLDESLFADVNSSRTLLLEDLEN
jgi:hypothetical protein